VSIESDAAILGEVRVRRGQWIWALWLTAPVLVAGCCSHTIEVPPANIALDGSTDIILPEGQSLVLRARGRIRLVGFPYRVVQYSCTDGRLPTDANSWVEDVTAGCPPDVTKSSWVTVRASDDASKAAHGARSYVCVEPCKDLDEYRRVRLVSRDR
jgi:hypothetical protein